MLKIRRETIISFLPGLSIYIHWPFCQAKCPYCDFNSHVRKSINQEEWTKAYISNLNFWAKKTSQNRISTIFFGGGTPSLMSEKTVNEILETIFYLWNCQSNLEISLEANPTSVETKKFKAFKNSGINRLSMGIQALNDQDLKRLGRLHTSRDAQKAFDIASESFNRVSFDLIYGRQHQTLKDWETELLGALKMSIGHLSLYQLTIEENTRFSELLSKGKLKGLPADESSINFYNLTNDICESENLPAYEISNHAKKGDECQHNLNYWRGGAFLGVGPGAHGRLNMRNKRYLTEAPSNPDLWLKLVKEQKFESFISKHMSNNEQGNEYIIMGLRLKEGFNIDHHYNLTQRRLPMTKLSELQDQNLIQIDQQMLKTTKSGKLLTDYVIRQLLC